VNNRISAQFIIASLTISILSQLNLPVSAQSKSRFYCDTSGSAPIIKVRTSRGNESFIKIVNRNRRYSAVRRCNEVASRLERHHRRGSLHLTSRRSVNGYPVVCATESPNGACDSRNVLITLRRGSDHKQALRNFDDFRRAASNRPLELSGDTDGNSTPLELSGSEDSNGTPLELSGGENQYMSSNADGDSYYNLSAAVDSLVNQNTSVQKPDLPKENTPTQSTREIPPGWRF
jgi:hypothetical protein